MAMNDDAYFARCDELWRELARRGGGTSCSVLAAAVDMSSHEACAKLRSLLGRGMARYDAGVWHALVPGDDRRVVLGDDDGAVGLWEVEGE